jgi:hypothetical protein
MSRVDQDGSCSSESTASATCDSDVLKYKKRMLEWSNPVEYVNNMYGCHPDEDGDDEDGDGDRNGDDDGGYFSVVFA